MKLLLSRFFNPSSIYIRMNYIMVVKIRVYLDPYEVTVYVFNLTVTTAKPDRFSSFFLLVEWKQMILFSLSYLIASI